MRRAPRAAGTSPQRFSASFFASALMSAASHWSVVEALETVLKKLTRETARNEENDALLDALRIATEGLEDCGRFAAMIARDAKGA